MARECIAVLFLALVGLSSFFAGGPVLIVGVKELTKECHNKVHADVVNVESTSEYGMCSVLVRYTDHDGVMHETSVQRNCAASTERAFLSGCYNARHPDTLFTDEDHIEDVTSYSEARAKVIAGTVLVIFAGVAVFMLCVWAVYPVADSRSPTARTTTSDSKAVPQVVRQDSVFEMTV